MFLYLLGISLPFHLFYIAVSGVGFLYSGGLCFLFIVDVSHRGWVGQFACQVFLVSEACIGALLHRIVFLLFGMQWSVQ